MTKVLKCDCASSDEYVTKHFSSLPGSFYIQADLGITTAALMALQSATNYGTASLINLHDSGTFNGNIILGDFSTSASLNPPTMVSAPFFSSSHASIFPADQLVTVIAYYDGTNVHWTVNGTAVYSYVLGGTPSGNIDFGGLGSNNDAGEVYYVTNVKIGTTLGGTDLFQDDFSSGNTSAWTSATGSPAVVDDPFAPPPSPMAGRVLIAWDDGPLVASPTWTRIDDQTGATFPLNFVSGYDTKNGRQNLISQTETGTATVYINDRAGLFDDRNTSSPYHGKLSGRQIMLQLLNPVTSTWEPQFRGLIDTYTYDIDGSAVGADGNPINASIQIECVDMFDYLEGYGLTPGLDGVTPPKGAEDSVYYAATSGTVDDRIIEILTDVGIDPTMWIVASGNVKALAVKYNADESALTALRDAADAELPFIANMYINRYGQFSFHGRYARFYPDDVAAEMGSDWDFTRWPLGDGKAIKADPTRGQLRLFSFSRDRSDLINAAIAYPQGIKAKNIPNQVFADATSITTYGKHAASPMSNLLTGDCTDSSVSPDTDHNAECLLYAELLVKNKKDPLASITALQLRSINPSDPRAAVTWGPICGADVNHIVNVAVGYPGGTGFSGASPDDDYYIEGRSLTVRPANPAYDDVTVDLEVSRAIWSMDTHSVFPDPF